LLLGWSTWNFGIQSQDVVSARQEVKEIKKEKKRIKKEEEKKQKEKENKEKVEANLEKQKNEGPNPKCAAITSSGNRCKNKAGKSGFCYAHD